MDVVGVWCRRYTRSGGVITPPVRLPEDVMPKYDCSRCSIHRSGTLNMVGTANLSQRHCVFERYPREQQAMSPRDTLEL
jgi:hypothetical protein